MVQSTVFVALFAFLFRAYASSDYLQKRSFSIQQSSPEERFKDGPAALRKAYLKHGIEVPEALEKRQVLPTGVGSAPGAKVTTSVIAITEKNDLEYLSPVEIGGTKMELDFDTGSSDLWVFSDKLPMQQRQSHTWYAAENSTTGQELGGLTWKISYGDGSGASGVVYADKVTVGEATATAQAVEAATSVSLQFVKEASDGLLGLGFGHTNTIKPTKQPTFFENIKASLKEPLFTVLLKKNASGVYDFGYVDKTKYTEPIQYVPINTTRGYWEYTATGYSVGPNSPMRPLSFQSIADTGTTLMLLPPAVAADYYSQVKGARNNQSEGGYIFPCDTALPDITVQMNNNVSVTVPGHFMNRSLSQIPGSTSCYGGIQQGSPTLSIWGDVFLKSQFAVFDGGEPPRIGFAKQIDNWSPQSTARSKAGFPGSGVNPSRVSSDAGKVGAMDWVKYISGTMEKFGLSMGSGAGGVIGRRASKRLML